MTLMKKENKIKLIKRIVTVTIFAVAILIVYGCISHTGKNKEQDFVVSGSEYYTDNNSADEEYLDSSSLNNHEDFTEKTQENEYSYVAVYVCGAVKNPGVIYFNEDARVDDAINAAGGFTKDASELSVNRADKLTDGQMIVVLTKDEYEKKQMPDLDALDSTAGIGDSKYDYADDGRTDINSASRDELMAIPGIGEAKARAIIAYRQDKGAFCSIEDIKNVDGIAEGIFSKIKEYITVK